MEENSDAHMETDVSSTTDDVPETQEVTGSHRDVEMVIVVEKVKEEDDSSLDLKDEQEQGSKISSASTSTEASPLKVALPQKTINKPPVIENNVSKSLLLSPVNYEPQNIPNRNSQPSVPNKSSLIKQQPESSDASMKVETQISPGKTMEKINDRSPIKISHFHKVIHKSPFKDMKLMTNSPIKQTKVQEKSPNKVINIQEKFPAKTIEEKPDTEVKVVELQEKSANKAVNLQENSIEQVALQEKSPNKGINLQEQPSKEVKLHEKSISKEKLVEPTPSSGIKLVEKINKETKSVNKSTTEDKFKDSSTICTPSNDESELDSSNPNSIIPSRNTSLSVEKTIKSVNGGDNTDIVALPGDEDLNKDLLNDSQSSIDVTEKEHNKSISRELKSLIKSAKDSKIISECTQLTSKTRKSRSHLDTSNTSLNVSLEADKVGSNRRGSTNSQASTCSEKSDRAALKRSMRSQNPEFVSKCKQFLNSVTSKVMKDSDEAMSEDETNSSSKKKHEADSHVLSQTDSSPTCSKRKKVSDQPVLDDKQNKFRSDAYCWRCHWTVEQEENDKAHPPLQCTVCPRSYHYKCLSTNEKKTPPEKKWVCPDCLQVLHAESSDTRSQAMKKTSLGMLCDLLKYALERMMDLNGVEPFMHPVDRTKFPDYDKYVVHPMNLTQMKQNIVDGFYGSTDAFIADAQWILHNSIIFNTLQSKLTGGARALVRSCRAEMGEIEACPECYAAAHARKPTWFTDVCTTPHILLWAKLKGFPYWPAKGMTVNSSGLVDVRFFGAHDRAWVPAKDCFLFSEKDPNNFRNKRQDILDSMQEAEMHIRNISRKYGKFVYPPFKTQFEPSKLTEQLKMMIPSFEGEIKAPIKEKSANSSPFTAKVKRRSKSTSSKSFANDGDGSESEDTSTSARTEVIRHDNENSSSGEMVAKASSPVEGNVPSPVETIATRKRRRSNLEEAVMTVIETSTVIEKKKRIDSTEQKKTIDSTEQKKRIDNAEQKKKIDNTEQKKKIDSTEQKKSELQEPSSSKEENVRLISKDAETTSTSKKKIDTPKGKSKDEEPSSSTMEEKESLRVTPIKLVALPRQNKQTPKMFAATKIPSKPSTPKDENKTPQRRKSNRSDKSSTSDKSKEDKAKSQKRNSRLNKSLNSTSSPKVVKTTEKKIESNNDSASGKELRPRDNKKKEAKETDVEANKSTANHSLLKPLDSPKSSKDRLKYDDDTSLAILARERRSNSGLPTISSVCSLSTTAQISATTVTPTTSVAQSIEITFEANSNSSIFTPTSTDNVRNMKEAVTKLQKLRENTEPVVGRVGVRAFARMTSPDRSNDNVEVEIKAEPVDLDEADAERHNEKMDLMSACNLQPVNPPQTLRDVRINRVVVGPAFAVKKGGKVEARPRAKKSFPQPRRAEDSRSELNGKNSMVYIPIQPPATQAPGRRVGTSNAPRPIVPASGNNAVNTLITPLKPTTSTLSSPSGSTAVPTVGQVGMPTVGPTTVHTVPLMTSVNGQWMFSLQPVMSVGGVDNSSPMVNGLADRGSVTPTLVSIPTTATANSSPATPAQVNRTTNDTNTPTELPRLQQRPALPNPLDGTGGGTVPAPAAAGPLTAKLNQHAGKLAEFFRSLLEDTIEKLDEPTAVAATLRLQMEQSRWRHQQELDELKHNHELTLAEMRLSFEKDKLRLMTETRRAAQIELDAAVRLTKTKQWCANCNQEAQFYCCWNTAYCDYPCQRSHWSQHFAHCAQRPKDGNEDVNEDPESRLQPQPSNLPKSVPAQTPALTVGGKMATARVYTQPDAAPQKTSIIVSMVEDNSGNQTMKCVGTFKQTQPQGQIPPLIINKPQVVNEETSKKVVTSGGYLIVGAGGNSASVITPAPTRRSHAIQYFT